MSNRMTLPNIKPMTKEERQASKEREEKNNGE